MDELAILTECYADTNLIETLVPPVKGYNHQHNCVKVALVMQNKYADGFALGIIDKDKKGIAYLSEFECIVSSDTVLLHKHKIRNHYIIQLSPAVEGFILKAARSLNISLDTLNLSDDLERLKYITKRQDSKRNPVLKKAIKQLSGAPNMQIIKEWIEYLKLNPYSADVTYLKSIFCSHYDD